MVDSTPGTCSSILTEFGIEFLTADFGSVDNPQRGIVGARFNYVSGSISYRCLDLLDCVDLSTINPGAPSAVGTASQAFRIKSTVSFVNVGTDWAMSVPPPPRLIPPLPNDIFYPFKL